MPAKNSVLKKFVSYWMLAGHANKKAENMMKNCMILALQLVEAGLNLLSTKYKIMHVRMKAKL